MDNVMEQGNITVLNVGYAETRHQWGNRDISSPFARLYYVKKGRARLYMTDSEVEVSPGHMYLVPMFAPHRYECGPGTGFYYMFVFGHGLAAAFDNYEFPVEVDANEAVDLLFSNYCTLYPGLSLPYASAEDFDSHPAYHHYATRYTQMEHFLKMQLQGLAFIILSYFVKHAAPRPEQRDERLRRVADYVKQNMRRGVSLADMAGMAQVTKTHLIHLFRGKMGITPLQYVIRKRIQHAQGLLLTTNMTVGQIARSVGVDDVSYFVRIFRKNIGFTPQGYRGALR